MDSREIALVLSRDRFTRHHFRGVFASDELPRQTLPRPSALVVNTDPSTKPGRHWLAVYITRDGTAEYFDSYGRTPWLPSVQSFLAKNGKGAVYNHRRLQGIFSTVCGQYCTFFLMHRCRGWNMATILNLFSNDLSENDRAVNEFIRTRFPSIDTEVYDGPFLRQQISKSLVLTL